jgi:hypothetical protein
MFKRVGTDSKIRPLLSLRGDDPECGFVFAFASNIASNPVCQAMGIEPRGIVCQGISSSFAQGSHPTT